VNEKRFMTEYKKVSGTYKLPYVIRSSKLGYLIYTVLFLPFILIAIYKYPNFLAAFVFIFILLFFLSALYAFRIDIEKDKLVYRALFYKPAEVQISNIRKIRMGSEYVGRGASMLYFYIHEKGKSKPIKIPVLFCRKIDLTVMADALLTINPSIEMDNRIRQIKENKFKELESTYLRESMNPVWKSFLIFGGIGIVLVLVIKLIFRH